MSMLCLSVALGQKKSIHTGPQINGSVRCPHPNSQHLRLLLYMAKGIVQMRVETLRWENDLDYLGQPNRITSVYGRANQTATWKALNATSRAMNADGKRAPNQNRQATPRSWKKRKHPPLEPSGRNTAFWDPGHTSDLQNREIIKWWCSKATRPVAFGVAAVETDPLS